MMGRVLMAAALLSMSALPIGAFGTKFGLWSFVVGGAVMLIGVVLAAMVFVLAGALLVRGRRGAPVWKTFAVAAVPLVVAGFQVAAAASYPRIHNVTTNPDDAPAFDAIVSRREGANPHEYDPALAPIQRESYPELAPLALESSPDDIFDRTTAALEAMGLDIVAANRALGSIEATATSFWFGFEDDVVIRIRAAGTGSVVDVRSVSRVGRGDLGANAARIQEILDRLGS